MCVFNQRKERSFVLLMLTFLVWWETTSLHELLLLAGDLRGVYSDTTWLNSTDPVEQRTAKSVVFLFMTSRPTNWVNCSRCRVEFSWVELCRYKHPLTPPFELSASAYRSQSKDRSLKSSQKTDNCCSSSLIDIPLATRNNKIKLEDLGGCFPLTNAKKMKIYELQWC